MFGILELPKGFILCDTYAKFISTIIESNPESLKDTTFIIKYNIEPNGFKENRLFFKLLSEQKKLGFHVIIVCENSRLVSSVVKHLIDCKIKLTAVQII